MNRVIRAIFDPKRIIRFLVSKNYLPMKDDNYLRLSFLCSMGYKLDLSNPVTFNEKLQWLKLYDRKEIYTSMVDKFEAKNFIGTLVGKQYVIPTLGIYNNFDEINFDNLPNQFVIKCTHDSGGLVVVKDKSHFNKKNAKKVINKSLKVNYFYPGREWPYKNIKPRIIVEKYMEDEKTHELRDYKFFCFNGKVKIFKIDYDRMIDHHANYYDKSGNLIHCGEILCPPDYNRNIDLPVNLKKMIKFAEILSANIPFLRVDFYEIDSKIYVGELTFYPASGFGKFTDSSFDYELGNFLDLGLVMNNEK